MTVVEEASQTVISGDAAEILHSRSFITPAQAKLFGELDEDYADFLKKLRSWKQPELPPFLPPMSPLEPPTQDSSSSKDKSKDSQEVLSEMEKFGHAPIYKTLASKLGLSKDVMSKYYEFSVAVPALNFYNQQNGTNFKLVDTIKCRLFYLGGMWAHCVFRAALPDSTYTTDFFAEVLHNYDTYELKYQVTTVTPLQGTPSYKCPVCDGLNIAHPQNFVSQAISP